MARFLKHFGTDIYHIEFNGFFTNHLMHGVVALVGLGAPDTKVLSFAEHYATQLEPASKKSEGIRITQETLTEFQGKKTHYPELIEFFSAELKSLHRSGGNCDPLAVLLRQYIPGLVDSGIGAAAFHPIIHIGYGLMQDSSGEFMASQSHVVDGLAYMVFSCRDRIRGESSREMAESMIKELGLKNKEVTQWGHGHEYGIPDLSDSLQMLIELIRSDNEAKKMMSQLTDYASSPEYDSIHPKANFQRKMAAMCDHGADLLSSYTKKALTALHSRFRAYSTQCGDKPASFISYLMKALIDGAIGVYANLSVPDDFFLTHGVTSAWALRRVLHYFDSLDVSLQILIAYTKEILSTYITQGMPAIVIKELPTELLPSWKDIIKKTVECSDDVDEHVYKLVYTCHEAEKVYGSSSHLYKRAAAQKMGFIDWPML
jgi:20S proteasome subunit beta 1